MAAVASRINNSPSLTSKVMSSPKNSKKTSVKSEGRTASPFGQDSRPTSPRKPDSHPPLPTIRQPEDVKPAADTDKERAAPATNAPLAPPPRPNQNGERDHNNNNNNGDFFGGSHFSKEPNPHFSKEPNPFENAFGGSGDTPGKTQLPGVSSLTSPAPLLGANTPGWPSSLRSGPLSPAMLTGPAGSNDYFSGDHHFSGSFPTPNESSLRTGLTPGGGGSMFPAPSPNSQAIFNAIQSGGATPGTLDFHRTAMHARAASATNTNFNLPANGATSQPQDMNIQPNLDSKGFGAPGQQQPHQDQFEQHDANDAANGLFMLAQARGNNRNGQQQQQQYPAPQQQPQMNYMQNAMNNQMQQQHDASNMAKRDAKNSVGSNMSGSTQGGEDHFSESGSEQAKPSARSGRGKKGSSTKATNGRRKAEDTPIKGGSNKRQKNNNGSVNQMMDGPDDMDSEDEGEEPQVGADGRKLTDEEKRKNFLERNRIAALKCRQRKKQWLANLQQKVEIFSTENDALAATVTQLREEIVGLKTLLLAHKDCPVSQAQGISGMAMQNIAGDSQQYANPYGMGMQGMPQHGMPPQGNMQRR